MVRWALLVGEKGKDKAGALARLAAALVARGLVVGGVAQEPIVEKGPEDVIQGGERVGYRARRIGTDESVPLARRGGAPRPGEDAFCSFVFERDGFLAARRWLAEDGSRADVIIVDEVSKLEVAGAGHHDAVLEVLRGRALPLLVVRADQLFAVMERFGLDEPLASAAGIEDEASLAEAIASAVRERR
jgi:nucleoside-triphosphatase THEP1